MREANFSIVPQFFNKSKSESFTFDWLKMDVLIKKLFYMDVFIGMTVDSNVYDTSNNSFYLGTPGHDCPLPKPFFKNSKEIVGNVQNKSNGDDEMEVEMEEKRREEAHRNIFKFVIKNIFANQSIEIPKESLMDEAYDVMYNMSEDFENVCEFV